MSRASEVAARLEKTGWKVLDAYGDLAPIVLEGPVRDLRRRMARTNGNEAAAFLDWRREQRNAGVAAVRLWIGAVVAIGLKEALVETGNTKEAEVWP